MLIPDIQYQELNFCLDIKLCLKLYTIVVQNVKNETKKKREIAHVIVFFLLINLGVPAVFVAVWAIVRAVLADAR